MWRAESPEGKDTEGSCLLAAPAGQKSGLGGLWSLTGLEGCSLISESPSCALISLL